DDLASVGSAVRDGDAVPDPSVRAVAPQVQLAALEAAAGELGEEAAGELLAGGLGLAEGERGQEPEHGAAVAGVLPRPGAAVGHVPGRRPLTVLRTDPCARAVSVGGEARAAEGAEHDHSGSGLPGADTTALPDATREPHLDAADAGQVPAALR